MKRMPSEEGGDEDTGPIGSGHPVKQQEQKQGVCNMKEEICEVMSAWIKAVEGAISHVRQPGYRMPIAEINGAEGPTDARPGQAGLNVRVLGNVFVVIVVDEFMMSQRPIAEQGDGGEGEANGKLSICFSEHDAGSLYEPYEEFGETGNGPLTPSLSPWKGRGGIRPVRVENPIVPFLFANEGRG